jgi:hypothetical protein
MSKSSSSILVKPFNSSSPITTETEERSARWRTWRRRCLRDCTRKSAMFGVVVSFCGSCSPAGTPSSAVPKKRLSTVSRVRTFPSVTTSGSKSPKMSKSSSTECSKRTPSTASPPAKPSKTHGSPKWQKASTKSKWNKSSKNCTVITEEII